MEGSSSSAAKDALKEWAALTTDGMLAETSGKVPFLKTILKDWKVPINFGNAEEDDSTNEKQKCVRIIVRFPASLLSEDTKTNASENNTSESCCLSVDFKDVDLRTLAPPEVPILIQFHGDDSMPLETNHVLLQEVVDLVQNAPEGVSKDVIVVNVDYRLASEEEQRYRSFPIPQGILDALSVMEYLLGGNNNDNNTNQEQAEEEKEDAQQPSYRTNIHVTGHSDGANLAMVAGFEAARRYPGSIASVQTQSPTVDPATFDPTYLDLSKIVPNIGLLRWCWKSYLGLARKLKTTRRVVSNQNDNENENYKEENIDKNNKSQDSAIDSDKNTTKHDDNDYNTIESEYYTMESSERNDFTMEGSDRNEDDATEDARVSDQDDDDDDNDKDYNTFESDIITNDNQEDDGGNDFNTIESAYYTMQSSDRVDLTMEGSDGIEEDSSIHARGGGSDKDDDDDNDYNTIESVFNTLDSGDIESSEYTTLHSGETNDKDSSEHARVSDHDDDSTGNDHNTIDSGDTTDDNEYNTIDSSSKTDNDDSDDTNDTDAMTNALDSIRYNENDHITIDSSRKNDNFKSNDTNDIDAIEEALGSIRYDDNTTSDSSSKCDNDDSGDTNDIDAIEDAFGSIRYDDNNTIDSSSKSNNEDSGDTNDMGAIEEAFGSIHYDDNDHNTSDSNSNSNSKSDNDEPTERAGGSSHGSIL